MQNWKCDLGKVSVVVTVYNLEKYVERCLVSLMNQSYGNIEIIVVDDGSRDASARIVRQYMEKDSRIQLVQQENFGVAEARNAGLHRACGEYLTFVDGDDYVGKDYIRYFVEAMEKTKAEMVLCGLTEVDSDGIVLKTRKLGEYVRFQKEEYAFLIALTAARCYRREVWCRYDVSFCADGRGEDMPVAVLFAALCNPIATLPYEEYYYVQHEQSAIHNFKGLKTFKLPYRALEQAIIKVQEFGIQNSREYHELFVFRVLATFIQLARGADRGEVEGLAEYINRIIDGYYPDYAQNKKLGLFSGVDMPLFHKVAVSALVAAKRLGCLSLLIKVFC